MKILKIVIVLCIFLNLNMKAEKVYSGELILKELGAKGLTNVRSSDKRKHAKSFKLADSDSNQYLEYQEYVVDGKYQSESDRNYFFLGADANGDQLISEDEFISHIFILEEGVKIFMKMDSNTDWKIITSEILKKSGIRVRSTVVAVFKKFDKDKNNEISYEEFIVKWTYWSRSPKK